MSAEKLMVHLYTDLTQHMTLKTPNTTEQMPVDIVGCIRLGRVCIEAENFVSELAVGHSIRMDELRAARLMSIFREQVQGTYGFEESHAFVSRIENDGKLQSVSPHYVRRPPVRTEDGLPYTFIDDNGNPLLSGYVMHNTGALLTRPYSLGQFAVISNYFLNTSQIIKGWAPTLLHNDPKWS